MLRSNGAIYALRQALGLRCAAESGQYLAQSAGIVGTVDGNGGSGRLGVCMRWEVDELLEDLS